MWGVLKNRVTNKNMIMIMGERKEENEEGGVPTIPTNADGDTSEDWYISDKVIASFTVPALDIQIKRRGILPKGRKAERAQYLRTCDESKMKITNDPIANMKVGTLPPLGY